MNVALFDWTVGGHHGRYVRRFAEVLTTAGARVTVAVPDVALPVVDGLWDPLESTCRHASLSIL